MSIFLEIMQTDPFLFIGLIGVLLIFISLILHVFFYIYININLKSINKILFEDEMRYKRPVEPFDFIYLSYLPTTFWRELLNLKYGKSFKKLYAKDFYFSLSKDQLIELLKKHKWYFIFQYTTLLLTVLGILLAVLAYIVEKHILDK